MKTKKPHPEVVKMYERIRLALRLPPDQCVTDMKEMARTKEFGAHFPTIVMAPIWKKFAKKYGQDIQEGKFNHIIHGTSPKTTPTELSVQEEIG